MKVKITYLSISQDEAARRTADIINIVRNALSRDFKKMVDEDIDQYADSNREEVNKHESQVSISY